MSPSVLNQGPRVLIECQLINPEIAGPLASWPSEIRCSYDRSVTFSIKVGDKVLLCPNNHAGPQDGAMYCSSERSSDFVGKRGCFSKSA